MIDVWSSRQYSIHYRNGLFGMQILVAGVPSTLNVEGTTSLLSTLIHPGYCTTPVWVSSAGAGDFGPRWVRPSEFGPRLVRALVSSAHVAENKRVVEAGQEGEGWGVAWVVVGLGILGKVIRISRYIVCRQGCTRRLLLAWLGACSASRPWRVRSLWLFRCVAFVLGPGSWWSLHVDRPRNLGLFLSGSYHWNYVFEPRFLTY